MSRAGKQDDFFSEDDGSFGFSEDKSSIHETKESELKFTFDHIINLQEEHTKQALRSNHKKGTMDPCLSLTEQGKQYLKENNYIEFTFTRIEDQIKASNLSSDIKEEFLSVISAISESSDEIFKNTIEAALEQSFRSERFIQPRIIIILQKIEGSYSIKIEDNGTGFSQKYIAKFNDSSNFEKHVSEKNGGTDLGGIGQGMSMLKDKIINKFSGTIDISNSESGGAQININLTKLPTKIAIDVSEDELIARLNRGSRRARQRAEVAEEKTQIVELEEDKGQAENTPSIVELDEQIDGDDSEDIFCHLDEDIEGDAMAEFDAQNESSESEDQQSVAEMTQTVSSPINFFKRPSASESKPQASGQGNQQPVKSRICGF